MGYDGENHVASSTQASVTTSYTYDGNGLRIQKATGSTSTVYLFSGAKVVAEYDNGAAVASPSREYIYAGGRLLSTITTSGTTTTTVYHLSGHLSPHITTDASGNVIGTQAHYPFGEKWYETGTTTKYKFTSYERDPETGNDYAITRYHINRLGRFASSDPLAGSTSNPQSLNRYSYVANDPINLADPIGLFLRVPEPVVGGGGGDPIPPGCTLGTDPEGNPIADCSFQPPPPDPPTAGGGHGGGGGGGVHKTFSKTFQCNTNAAGAIQQVEADFSKFADFSGTFGPLGIPVSQATVLFGRGAVTQGHSIPITDINLLPNPFGYTPIVQTISTSVTVQSVTSSSFSFSTDPGHVLQPASISFSATDAGSGQINFSIQVDGQFANRADEALYYLGGNDLENKIWNNLLSNIKNLCNPPKAQANQ